MPGNAAQPPTIRLIVEAKSAPTPAHPGATPAPPPPASWNDVLITYAWPAAFVLVVLCVCVTIVVCRAAAAWAKRRDAFYTGTK